MTAGGGVMVGAVGPAAGGVARFPGPCVDGDGPGPVAPEGPGVAAGAEAGGGGPEDRASAGRGGATAGGNRTGGSAPPAWAGVAGRGPGGAVWGVGVGVAAVGAEPTRGGVTPTVGCCVGDAGGTAATTVVFAAGDSVATLTAVPWGGLVAGALLAVPARAGTYDSTRGFANR